MISANPIRNKQKKTIYIRALIRTLDRTLTSNSEVIGSSNNEL